MIQQINLYRFTARESVWRQYSPFPQAAVGLVLILLVVSIFSWLDKSKLDVELQNLTQQHDQLAQQLETLASIDNGATIGTLQSEVTALETELSVRQATMTSIKAEGAANNHGFSQHLEGLANQHFDGLWLTAIALEQGGQRIGLEGFAGEPEMVPRYIGRLSNEKVFTGTEFDVFSLQRQQSNVALAFEVTTVTEDEKQ